MIRGHPLRVDLLTPASGARNDKPIPIPRFKTAAQPLEMLGYLLEAAVSAPIVNGGAALVNVPDPARFALHKLIISGRRQVHEQTKAAKDRQQAGELIDALYQDRRGDLDIAIDALIQKGGSWRSRLKTGLAKLPDDLSDSVAYVVARLDR